MPPAKKPPQSTLQIDREIFKELKRRAKPFQLTTQGFTEKLLMIALELEVQSEFVRDELMVLPKQTAREMRLPRLAKPEKPKNPKRAA